MTPEQAKAREIAECLVKNYGADPDGLLVGAIRAALTAAKEDGRREERERCLGIARRFRHRDTGHEIFVDIESGEG